MERCQWGRDSCDAREAHRLSQWRPDGRQRMLRAGSKFSAARSHLLSRAAIAEDPKVRLASPAPWNRVDLRVDLRSYKFKPTHAKWGGTLDGRSSIPREFVLHA
mmetsp:Transcript_41897/g.97571  ORF Transcript_41897/g.97571 Transcript_41897/m.97571 type:complete len:104 (-) Transcript_41897:224-535(-)